LRFLAEGGGGPAAGLRRALEQALDLAGRHPLRHALLPDQTRGPDLPRDRQLLELLGGEGASRLLTLPCQEPFGGHGASASPRTRLDRCSPERCPGLSYCAPSQLGRTFLPPENP